MTREKKVRRCNPKRERERKKEKERQKDREMNKKNRKAKRYFGRVEKEKQRVIMKDKLVMIVNSEKGRNTERREGKVKYRQTDRWMEKNRRERGGQQGEKLRTKVRCRNKIDR